MDTTRALRLLHEHQQGILNYIGAAEASAASAARQGRAPHDANAPPVLARVHWDLARRLRAYRLFKHAEIFCPAIAQGDRDQRETAARAMMLCDKAAADFDAYVLQWSGPTTDAVRHDAAMLALMTAIRTHLVTESETIERLVEGWQDRGPAEPVAQMYRSR